jgi:hypothetical protein
VKVRIKQIGNEFYPQRRKFFLWWYYERFAGYDWYETVSFDSLLEAREFLDKQLEAKIKPVVKIHKHPDDYNPDAHCNMTAALKQSECGTNCCTPDEE